MKRTAGVAWRGRARLQTRTHTGLSLHSHVAQRALSTVLVGRLGDWEGWARAPRPLFPWNLRCRQPSQPASQPATWLHVTPVGLAGAGDGVGGGGDSPVQGCRDSAENLPGWEGRVLVSAHINRPKQTTMSSALWRAATAQSCYMRHLFVCHEPARIQGGRGPPCRTLGLVRTRPP